MKCLKKHVTREKAGDTFCVNLFFSVTLLLFGPLEIFIYNSNDFQFTLFDFGWMLGVWALGYLAIATIILMFLPDKVNAIIVDFIFAFTLCCYAQVMFMNGKMKVLVGREIVWDKDVIIFNLLAWIAIFVLVFVIKYYLKEKGRKLYRFLSLAIVAMQFVALLSLLLTTNVLNEKKSGYLSTEGMFRLSEESNVIVFILDYFDGRTMKKILEQDEDFMAPLDGFTYYPNATSVHSRTYPSITYLLTGNMCYFDKEPMEYINTAFAESSFIPNLYENQIEVGLYTSPSYIGNSAKTQICNYCPAKQELRFMETIRVCAKMVLYRDMPYLVKKRFEYEIANINNRVVRNKVFSEMEATMLTPRYRSGDDEWFYDTLIENGINTGEKEACFRFYHLASCHKNLSDPIPYGIRSFEIVYEYLDQMRELGIYEDATIIITTDHGSSGGGETLDMPHKTAVPLMIVKPTGVSGDAIKVSDAPVSHTDLIPTIVDGFSLPYEAYGRTVYDVSENEARDRFYYYTALYTDEEGEIELREYRIRGDARNSENYRFTGNKWEVRYSYNRISHNK